MDSKNCFNEMCQLLAFELALLGRDAKLKNGLSYSLDLICVQKLNRSDLYSHAVTILTIIENCRNVILLYCCKPILDL